MYWLMAGGLPLTVALKPPRTEAFFIWSNTDNVITPEHREPELTVSLLWCECIGRECADSGRGLAYLRCCGRLWPPCPADPTSCRPVGGAGWHHCLLLQLHAHVHTHIARVSCDIVNIMMQKGRDGATSSHLVPAGAQRLEEAEAVNGDQGSRIQDAQFFMLLRTTITQG